MTSTPYRTIGRGPASSRGFTLIEIMIVVAIIAVLAAIALPQYRDYVLRGQLVEASTELSAMRASMERYYQDNRTYANVSATLRAPCDSTNATLRTFKYFTLTCTGARDDTQYTLLATGRGPALNFDFTVNQTGAQTTQNVGSPGWGTPAGSTCWILSRGQAC